MGLWQSPPRRREAVYSIVNMIMDHSDILGNPKLVKTCSLPLTGQRVVQRAITNLGVVDIQ